MVRGVNENYHGNDLYYLFFFKKMIRKERKREKKKNLPKSGFVDGYCDKTTCNKSKILNSSEEVSWRNTKTLPSKVVAMNVFSRSLEVTIF